MESDIPQIPESLVKALKAKEVIPFIGAGVSMAVKKSPLEPEIDKDGKEKKDKLGNIRYKSIFPSWWEFLLNAADKLDKEKIGLNTDEKSQKAIIIRALLEDSPVDYLDIAQRAFDSLGTRHWEELLRENFEKDIDEADEDSKKLAKLVWQFGNNLIVTTNIDLVLQSTHEKPQRIKILDTQVSEFAGVQKNWHPSRPTVLYLHGHIDNGANVVFTKDQYRDFYNKEKNRAKLETLHNLLTQRTILFIGFSLDDLHILKELERVNLIYKGGANSFYALIREAEKDNPNIPGYVERIIFSEFGKPLEDLIDQLIQISNEDSDSKKKEIADEIKTTTKPGDKENTTFSNVPFASKGTEFVGRTGKMEEIWKLLNKEGCASIGQAVSVKGFGGLGKTQLAVEYAHAYKDKYPNGIYWLVADENIDNQLLQIADKQGWINNFDRTVNQLDVAKAIFLELSNCLILFDNVESYADIKDYLPKTDLQTHLLITSREKLAEFNSINLELLERDESRELLLKIANRVPKDDSEKDHLENILEILGDIPLAVELVGGYLAEHETITFAKYHQFLNDVPLNKLEKEFPEGSFTNHDRSIIQTLRISEKTIKEKPLMVEILNVLAWSGNSSMGISLLQTLVETEDEFEFETALADAHKLRILKKDEGLERYAIHRLLAKVIQHEKPLASNKKWFKKIVDNLELWFRKRANDFDYSLEFADEFKHLIEWQENCFRNLRHKSVLLTHLRSCFLLFNGFFHEARIHSEAALQIYEDERLDNPIILGSLYNALGMTYRSIGKFQKALEYQIKTVEICDIVYEPEHPDRATYLSNLGLIHSDLGNVYDALECQLNALQIREELFSKIQNTKIFTTSEIKLIHNDISVSLTNVGLIYNDLEEFNKGLDFHFRALKIAQEIHKTSNTNTLNILNNIGHSYEDLGNFDEALKYHFQALEMGKEIYGKVNDEIATSLGNIATTYHGLNNLRESLNFQEQALEMRQSIFGDTHTDVALSLHNLGLIYIDLNEAQKGIVFLKKSLEIYKKVLGNGHLHTIRTCHDLIFILLKTGLTSNAITLAVEFFKEVPQNHPRWKFFEEISRPYRKNKHRHKKGRR